MAKRNSWLNEQFREASSEVESWSTSKQNAMKNAVKSKSNQYETKSINDTSRDKKLINT